MMKPLTIGVAAFALIAAGALAAQGNGHGKGNDNGHGKQSHAKVAGSMSAAAHGHGNAMRAATPVHGSGNAMRGAADAMRPKAQGNGHGQAKAQAHPGKGNRQDHATAERGHGPPANAPAANQRAAARTGARQGPSPAVRVLADGRRSYSAPGARPRFDFAAARRGPIAGCPPGLARKNDGCRPPGLARQRAWQPRWWGLPALTGPYYYNDGYLVRVSGDRIADYVPLLSGALAIGNPWPSYYAPMPVPDYYVNYYDLGPAGGYRYADDVLYRVDPSTSAITAIAALLTGDDFTIGRPLPPGYDIYNVPYAYRGQYADGPDAWYRYSDGYVYQVDPTTRLVTAAIQLLAS